MKGTASKRMHTNRRPALPIRMGREDRSLDRLTACPPGGWDSGSGGQAGCTTARSMSKLPGVSGDQVVAALQRIGFQIRRQHGSPIIMRLDEPFAQTVVPARRERIAAGCGRLMS